MNIFQAIVVKVVIFWLFRRVINACRKLRAMIATDKAKVIGAGSTHTSNSNGKSSAPAMSVVAAEDSTTTANKEAAVVVEISDSATDATEDAVGARATSGAQASKDGDDDGKSECFSALKRCGCIFKCQQ